MGLDLKLDVANGASSVRHPIVKVRGADASNREDQIAVEEPLEIRLGGMSLAVTMRTPGHDEELVAGLLFSEGAIASADDLDVVARYPGPEGERDTGNVINVLLRGDVTAARKLLRRNFIAASYCGARESLRTNRPRDERGAAHLREDRWASRGGALRRRWPPHRPP